MEIVGEATTPSQAIQEMEGLSPDLIILDVDKCGTPDLESIQGLVSAAPRVPILVLTGCERGDVLFQALEIGVKGYILTTTDLDSLLEAIQTIHRGEMAFSPVMATKLVSGYLKETKAAEEGDALNRLSPREREVLPLLAQERTDKEVAVDLHLSPYTVQTYRKRIMKKLDIHSKTELLKFALQRGLVNL